MIELVSLGFTILKITGWTCPSMQHFLGCSMKGCHSEFVDKNDGLLSSDKIKVMTDLVNKRQGLVNFTVKYSYKDGKKYTYLVSFEWVSE